MEVFEIIIIVVVLMVMRSLFATLFGAIIDHILVFIMTALPIILVVLVYLGSSKLASVSDFAALTQADIKRTRMLLKQQLGNPEYALKTLRLKQKDLNLIANPLFNHFFNSATQIGLNEGVLLVDVSIRLPDNLINPFVNVQFQLVEQDKSLIVNKLRLGQIEIADELAGELAKQLIKHSQLQQYDALIQQNVKGVSIDSEALIVNYSLPQAVNQSQQALAKVPDDDATAFYRQQMQNIIKNHDRKWLLSLADFLQPMFKQAYRRSQHFNPIDENRAIIYVVNSYVNQAKIQAILPKYSALSNAEYLPVFIYKRIDLAQHFMLSASLTVFANVQLTQLIGLEKEMHDAQKGSGFSFTDLAADRAGARFGKMATESKQTARQLQKKMAEISSYQAFMPAIEQLPENMTLEQFTERFNSVESKVYQEQLMLIDNSIGACAIYQ